jgi:hypothetical protein
VSEHTYAHRAAQVEAVLGVVPPAREAAR